MRSIFFGLSFLAVASCGPRVTGEVGRACIEADRRAATRTLCACVQQAANATLNGSDQIRAAEFFANPELAQQTRQSDRRTDERFWDRYKVFTQRSQQLCG